MTDVVSLAIRIEKLIQQADCDEKTRNLAVEFVWFSRRGHLMRWRNVRIAKERQVETSEVSGS